MKANYRQDIQGLRALSVILVFIAHAKWPVFTGGFIGVDIFFVISGYVITQLLLTEYRDTEAMVLRRFYGRRLQRLMPALIFMLIITTLVALLVLTPKEQLFQYESAQSAALWLSNMFFIYSNFNYFGPAATESIYLHTWSLGVEEQFYLIWPIILLAGLGRFSREKKHKNSQLATVLSITFIVSLLLCFFLMLTAPERAFYLMPARAWQFALGALVACIHMRSQGISRFLPGASALNPVAILGLGLITLAAVWFDDSTPYPNWQALIPSIGAAMLLWAYIPGNNSIIGTALSSRPMRWMGDISYSFYLWHWPILIFCKKLAPFYAPATSVSALALTFVMATFSYYVLEQPIRQNQKISKYPGYTICISLAVMFLTCIFLYGLRQYSTTQLSDPGQLRFAAAARKLPVIYQHGCDDWYSSARIKFCMFSVKDSEKTAVLIGDSILMQWFPAIVDHYNRQGIQLAVLTKSACPMVNRPYYYGRIKSVFHVCDTWREAAIKAINEMRPYEVVMGSSRAYPFSPLEWREGTSELIRELLPHTNRIHLIDGTPTLGFNGPSCLTRRAWLSRFFGEPISTSCTDKLAVSEASSGLGEIVTEFPEVNFIEMSDVVCPGGVCSAISNDVMVYRDHHHLTTEFVDSLKGVLSERLSPR